MNIKDLMMTFDGFYHSGFEYVVLFVFPSFFLLIINLIFYIYLFFKLLILYFTYKLTIKLNMHM